jgi:hypothetical protein
MRHPNYSNWLNRIIVISMLCSAMGRTHKSNPNGLIKSISPISVGVMFVIEFENCHLLIICCCFSKFIKMCYFIFST